MKNSRKTKLSRPIKRGDVIALGDHFLVCENAEMWWFGNYIQGEIDMILTDPPYGVDYAASKRGLGKIAKDKDIENDGFMDDEVYIDFSRRWLEACVPFLAAKNSVYVFNSDKMIFALREAFLQVELKVAQMIVWVKSQPVIGRLDYLPQHELILYGWSGTHDFRRGKDKSVIFERKPRRSGLHPTMKPIPLLRRLILNSTRVGDTVYDPFGGSGSTLIACEHTKRRCIMVEMDPEYCETIVKRWEKLTGHGAEILNSERPDAENAS